MKKFILLMALSLVVIGTTIVVPPDANQGRIILYNDIDTGH
ncbi:hypothetical protein P4H70_15105 [Paenibacillus ehimensis]|nr:hypothetical protein [Paenibacillus ehimensis]MEC0210265.1 hypothetical protein [Paenibacillus ehimensis]